MKKGVVQGKNGKYYDINKYLKWLTCIILQKNNSSIIKPLQQKMKKTISEKNVGATNTFVHAIEGFKAMQDEIIQDINE